MGLEPHPAPQDAQSVGSHRTRYLRPTKERCPVMGLCVSSCLLQAEASLMVAEQGTVLRVLQNVFRKHFIVTVPLVELWYLVFSRAIAYLVRHF